MIHNILRFIREIFTSGDRIHLEYYIDDNNQPRVKEIIKNDNPRTD